MNELYVDTVTKNLCKKKKVLHGEENGNPLQYFCLENTMDRGAWQATVLEVAKSQTWLSKWAHNFLIYLFLFSCQFLAFRAKPTRGTSESCAMISIMLVSVVISRIYLSSSHRTTWGKTHHISWLTKTTHYSHLPAHYLLHFSWPKLYDLTV